MFNVIPVLYLSILPSQTRGREAKHQQFCDVSVCNGILNERWLTDQTDKWQTTRFHVQWLILTRLMSMFFTTENRFSVILLSTKWVLNRLVIGWPTNHKIMESDFWSISDTTWWIMCWHQCSTWIIWSWIYFSL